MGYLITLLAANSRPGITQKVNKRGRSVKVLTLRPLSILA
jgi:hypothetical protein